MDALVYYRRNQGLSGLSINWGPWSGGGMAKAKMQQLQTRMGVLPLFSGEAVSALNYLFGATGIQTTVAKIDWPLFTGIYEARKSRLFLEQIEDCAQAPVEQPSAVKQTDLLQQMEAVSADERKNLLITYLQSEVAGIMEFVPSQLPGVDQGFFEMGMDSLMAMKLKQSLDASLGISLPLSMIFDCRTVVELSELLAKRLFKEDEDVSATGGRDVQAVSERNIGISKRSFSAQERTICLSFAQQRLWFLDQLEPNSPLYNITAAVRIKRSLDVNVLTLSFAEIIGRHETLRTTFKTMDGQPQQVIAPGMAIPLIVEDLRNLHEPDRKKEVLRLSLEDARRPFNLAQGPLLRWKLFRLRDHEYVLFLNMHHIISDGWSMGVLIYEFKALYEAFSGKRSSPLPELPVQYADFAIWQRQWLKGAELARLLSYWQGRLGGELPMHDLPKDRPRPLMQKSDRGASHCFLLTKELSKKLRELRKCQDVTLFMTLLAAFKTMLFRYTSQEDIIVGSPIANRNRAEIEGLIGFFANTLVLRTDLSGDPRFTKLFARVKKTTMQAYEYQDLPFEMLVEKLNPERDLSRTPLFQVMFVFSEFFA